MCNEKHLSNNLTVSIILLLLRFWWFISLNYRASPSMISSLVISSELHRDYQRLSMKVNLLISMSTMRPLVCWYSLHIKEAPDNCLQRQSECYLHPRWKGPLFLHQHHQYKTTARGQFRMKGLQVSLQVKERSTSFSFMMMIQIWAHKVPRLGRSSRSRKQRSKPYTLTWRELSGP